MMTRLCALLLAQPIDLWLNTKGNQCKSSFKLAIAAF
jgi:hypothetical protein